MKTPEVDLHPEVMQAMWQVIDAARLAIRLPVGVSTDEALEFLADQEKMFRRAVAAFHGEEEAIRTGDRHPFVRKCIEEERKRIEDFILLERNNKNA